MWEMIDQKHSTTSYRMWIPEGWLVRTTAISSGGNIAMNTTTVKDEQHLWVLNKEY